MRQLLVRAIEEFLRDTHGESLWLRVAAQAVGPGAPPPPTIRSDPQGRGRVERLVPIAAAMLNKPPAELFEDLGAWLARREAFRRLLRFSGRDFTDFVLSLEELPGRAHFVIPDLQVPPIRVMREAGTALRLVLPEAAADQGWTALLAGLLRAMADDYGALSLITVEGCDVMVQISDEAFAEARDFQLGGAVAGTAGATF